MNFNKNPIESDWNATRLKKEDNDSDTDKKATVRPKENRNFCERWLSIFSPWLTRCEDDSNRPFCRACQRPLDNNRFRLQRHERTAKHSRNQEILLNEGEDAVRLLLSRNRQRRRYMKRETTPVKSYPSKVERIDYNTETPLKRLKLPTAISASLEKNQKSIYANDKFQNTSDYYYSSRQYSRPPPVSLQPKKDCFDMFFEAISAAVKNLPPKLAAEVKSRISQVIAEFELRAICEKEAKEKAQQSAIAIPPQVANVVTIDPVINTETNGANTSARNVQIAETAPTVTQYVYSYQQKEETN